MATKKEIAHSLNLHGDVVYEQRAEIASLRSQLAEANEKLEEQEGWLHSCPTCGMKCKECQCMQARVERLEGACRHALQDEELARGNGAGGLSPETLCMIRAALNAESEASDER